MGTRNSARFPKVIDIRSLRGAAMNLKHRIAFRRSQAGLTLIELAITMSILVTVVGIAIPSFGQVREVRHMEGAAAQLETDIQQTRSLAVARNAPVRISFEAGAGASCYVVHTGAANGCSCIAEGNAVCSAGAEALRTVRFGAGVPLSVLSNSRSITFDPVKGTVTPTATMRVLGRSGAAIHQVVNVMGRVRSCTPAPGLPGYKRC
jgi:type IV fimbrial biogenesis protein FimT